MATVSSQPVVDDMERCSPPCQELQGGLETFSTYDGAWEEAPNVQEVGLSVDQEEIV